MASSSPDNEFREGGSPSAATALEGGMQAYGSTRAIPYHHLSAAGRIWGKGS